MTAVRSTSAHQRLGDAQVQGRFHQYAGAYQAPRRDGTQRGHHGLRLICCARLPVTQGMATGNTSLGVRLVAPAFPTTLLRDAQLTVKHGVTSQGGRNPGTRECMPWIRREDDALKTGPAREGDQPLSFGCYHKMRRPWTIG